MACSDGPCRAGGCVRGLRNGESGSGVMHKFEQAGLGKAPFRVVGYTREIYQAVPGDPNCPCQPGAACDYCMTAIVDTFWIRSSDGRRFKVGCDCVYKTG